MCRHARFKREEDIKRPEMQRDGQTEKVKNLFEMT